MGFLDFLSPALTVATGAAGAYEQGKTERAATEQKNTLTMLAQLRQAQQDAEKRTMDAANVQHLGAQTRLYGAQADQIGEPKPASPITLAPGAKLLTPRKGGGYDETANNPKDENETWKLSNDWLFNGQPIRESNRGNYQTVAGQPVEAGKLTRYTAPPNAAPSQLVDIDDPKNPGQKIKAWADPRKLSVTPTEFKAPASVGLGSAINKSSEARASAATSEMNNAHNGMASYEKGLADGTITIKAPAQLLQRMANSFTHDDPISQTAQSAALVLLNTQDKELARYIRRGLSFAEGESMISQRPSDFRTKLAAFLSTAASGASPEMIADIQSRRNSILTPLNEIYRPAPSAGRGGGAGGGATGGAKKPITAADAELAARDPEFKAYLQRNGFQVP